MNNIELFASDSPSVFGDALENDARFQSPTMWASVL